MIIKNVIYSVAMLFLMMIPGIIMKKCRLATDGLGKGISNLVLYIAQPALIFLAYVRPFDKEVLINSLWVLLFSVIAHGIFALVAFFFFKSSPDNARRMLRFATIFSNAAFMGIPLIAAVLGDDAVTYASIYNITFNLVLWTLGVHICTANRDLDGDGHYTDADKAVAKSHSQASIKKALIHPVTIAAALGLLFFLAPIDGYVPLIVIDSLTMLKNLVAPLSMLVIGLRLADISFKGIFSDKNMYIFLGLRHIALPLLLVAVFKLLMLFVPISEAVYLVVIIMASTPAASSATMFAEKYDCDASYVSRLVAFSTILSIATMPFVMFIASL